MDYSNPQIPEGINTSERHPLKDLAILSAGALVLVLVLLFGLALLMDWLTPKIPFSMELRITQQISPWVEAENKAPMNDYLQTLAEELGLAQGLAPDMPITVHYLADDTVNAFATLGGHIILFRGLLEKLPNENALAMVLAHEIAHIKHRHPIKSLGRGAVFALAAAMVGGATGSDFAAHMLGEAGLLTALKFSRDQEQQADETALAALAQYYGHVDGADELFLVFDALQASVGIEPPALFSSHPHTADRIQHIARLAKVQNWPLEAPVQPFPEQFKRWLNAHKQL